VVDFGETFVANKGWVENSLADDAQLKVVIVCAEPPLPRCKASADGPVNQSLNGSRRRSELIG
jgi:hypothetical protein